MNTKSMNRPTIRLASMTVVSLTAVLTLAGAGAASAIPNIPDPGPGTTRTGVAAWDGEANMAARHSRLSVNWCSKLA